MGELKQHRQPMTIDEQVDNIELLGFGTLSKFYKNMKNDDNKVIDQSFLRNQFRTRSILKRVLAIIECLGDCFV